MTTTHPTRPDNRPSCLRPRALLLAAVLAGALSGGPSAEAVRGQPDVPARIVSTSPSITETLFALGLGDRVVGVSAQCRFPAGVTTLPQIGSVMTPDAELIAALRPDLVVIHDEPTGLGRRLDALGVSSVVVRPDTLEGVFAAIRRVAAAAGVTARGDALVAGLRARLDAVRQAAATGAAPRVLFIMSRQPDRLVDLVGVGAGSYAHEVLEIAGGRNVLAIDGQPAYPRISMETALRLDPDVIVDTVNMGETELARRRRQRTSETLWATYPTLTAVRTGRIHVATPDAVFIPGPRVAEAAEWFAAILAGSGAR